MGKEKETWRWKGRECMVWRVRERKTGKEGQRKSCEDTQRSDHPLPKLQVSTGRSKYVMQHSVLEKEPEKGRQRNLWSSQ